MIARILQIKQLRELAMVAIAALVCAGVSAHAALRAIAASADAPTVAAPPPAGYETEDHFPGAALFYVADQDAAPAEGTTGTAALPDLPIPAGASFDVSDGTVHPALPFSMAAASGMDRARALQCLTAAIYYEAASESDAGQRAVAQVILNRVRHPAFPDTVCGVVYQGSERTTGCQFSFACDGAMARTPMRAAWDKALRLAGQALAGYVFAPVGLATHYHTYAVTPSWNRNLIMTDAIGAHFFHRWQGWWGTPAAFHDAYRGGEPFPGPHPRAIAPVVPGVALTTPSASLATLAAQATGTSAPPLTPPTALAMIQPAYAESGTLRTAAPGQLDALPQSQILDRWKDSGQPLR